jgi:hypothetical protein
MTLLSRLIDAYYSSLFLILVLNVVSPVCFTISCDSFDSNDSITISNSSFLMACLPALNFSFGFSITGGNNCSSTYSLSSFLKLFRSCLILNSETALAWSLSWDCRSCWFRYICFYLDNFFSLIVCFCFSALFSSLLCSFRFI